MMKTSTAYSAKTLLDEGEWYFIEEFSQTEFFLDILGSQVSSVDFEEFSAEDKLYFRKLASVTGIFKGIDQLYREATEDETERFLERDFITLKNDFYAGQVKTVNRKRIALAEDTLSHLQKEEQEKIFTYIGDYCPTLKRANGSFEIGNENDLKLLLYGIGQRFYTTLVGNEKRIANSVIRLD